MLSTVIRAIEIQTLLIRKDNQIPPIFPISVIDGPTETGLDMTGLVVQRLQLCLVCVSSVSNNVPVDRHVTRVHAESNGHLPDTGFFAVHTSVHCAFVRPWQDARMVCWIFLSVPNSVAQMIGNTSFTSVHGASDYRRDVTIYEHSIDFNRFLQKAEVCKTWLLAFFGFGCTFFDVILS